MLTHALLRPAKLGININNSQNLNMKDQESYSSGKHSSQSEEEKHYERKEKVEKPLKVRIPKHKHSFTVIGKLPVTYRNDVCCRQPLRLHQAHRQGSLWCRCLSVGQEERHEGGYQKGA